MYLRCSVQASPKDWTKWLPLAELWYNSAFHSSLQCSPFKALYDIEPSAGLIPSIQFAEHPDVDSFLREIQHFSVLLKDQLARAQNRMKVYADNNHSKRSFQVGVCIVEAPALCSKHCGQ
jgi:hypothetical protein